MSLLLVLIYFIGIPALVIAVAVWLWRKTDSSLARGLVVVGAMVTLAGLLWLAEGEKWQADRQVRELCAKDGGVKVYEVVMLPEEKFDKWGNVNIPARQAAKSSDEYYSEFEDLYLQQGRPNLLRIRTWIIRKSDGKVLGESIRYVRTRGELPGPWVGKSFMCPQIADAEGRLEGAIFMQENKK